MQVFNIGDLVQYTGEDTWKASKKETHIVKEVVYHGNNHFTYATNLGAWFTDTEFALVEKANAKSFAQLDKDMEDLAY